MKASKPRTLGRAQILAWATLIVWSASAQAVDPSFVGPLPQQIAPAWSDSADYSYYSGEERVNAMVEDLVTRKTLSLVPKELEVEPIDKGRANALLQSYNDMQRPYEEKEKWSTLTLQERSERMDAMRGFANGVGNEIRIQQFVERRDALVKLLPRKQLGQVVAKIPQSVQFAGAIAGAVMSGETLAWRLVPEAQIRASLDLLNQRSHLALSSSIVDASVSLRGQTPGNVDPNGPPPGEFPAKSYRYEISVGKSVPELQLSTGITYISTSESLRASVSKVIAPNLSAEVGTSQPLNPRNLLQPREESVRLQYGMQF